MSHNIFDTIRVLVYFTLLGFNIMNHITARTVEVLVWSVVTYLLLEEV